MAVVPGIVASKPPKESRKINKDWPGDSIVVVCPETWCPTVDTKTSCVDAPGSLWIHTHTHTCTGKPWWCGYIQQGCHAVVQCMGDPVPWHLRCLSWETGENKLHLFPLIPLWVKYHQSANIRCCVWGRKEWNKVWIKETLLRLLLVCDAVYTPLTKAWIYICVLRKLGVWL